VLLGRPGSGTRCLIVWSGATSAVGCAAVAARAWLAHVDASAATLRSTPLDVAVTEVAALALVGCGLWMWAVTSVVVAEVLREGAGHGRGSGRVPTAARRVVLLACGAALAGGVVHPSYAAGPDSHHAAGPRHRSPLSGLPLPDRAVTSRRPVQHALRVRAGDTLWSLAARDLPSGSTAARITRRWHAIYAVNRSVIGPDPDVIEPGERLRIPGKDPS
jgi:nucleoid-associated protein YgaU